MPESEGQPGNNFSAVSDETLKQYLLGSVVEDQRLQLDRQLLVDDGLSERVRLAESELIDDYAAQRLKDPDRELFVDRFLVTESRKQQLRVVSALKGYADSRSAVVVPPASSSWRERLGKSLGLERPRAWAIAGSFAAVILVIGLVWFAAKRRNETQPLIATTETVPAASPQAPTQTDLHSALPSPSPSPALKKPAVTGTPEPGPPPRVASYALVAGALRADGDMSRIAVPRGEHDLVRFSLTLDGLVSGPYRAELKTAEGQTVLVRNQLRATVVKGDITVLLEVAARLLPAGDYQLKLTSQKPGTLNQPAGTFYFRALNE